MEKRELTCIVCPVGCRITAEIDGGELRISGNSCKRGEVYCLSLIHIFFTTMSGIMSMRS